MSRSHPIVPCDNCPYRRDSPLGLWHKMHFEQVLISEYNNQNVSADKFGCHKQADLPYDQQGLCAGWLLDQKLRGIPNNIALRIRLMSDKEALAAFEAVHDGGNEMYDSADEMCRANIEHIEEGEER